MGNPIVPPGPDANDPHFLLAPSDPNNPWDWLAGWSWISSFASWNDPLGNDPTSITGRVTGLTIGHKYAARLVITDMNPMEEVYYPAFWQFMDQVHPPIWKAGAYTLEYTATLEEGSTYFTPPNTWPVATHVTLDICGTLLTQNDAEAYNLAKTKNLMPDAASYRASRRDVNSGKYEPDHSPAAESRVITLASYFDASNCLIKYSPADL